MSSLPPWIPNPADIEDGQFLQWNAALGRFEAVASPGGGGVEMQSINSTDLPFTLPFSDPLPPTDGTLTVTTVDGDQLVFDGWAQITNTDEVEGRTVLYFLMVFDEIGEVWSVIDAFTTFDLAALETRVFTVHRSLTIEIGGTDEYAIGFQASGAGPQLTLSTFSVSKISV